MSWVLWPYHDAGEYRFVDCRGVAGSAGRDEEYLCFCRKGEFVIEDGIEDVHSQVELMLTRKLGDVGKKIHSGRSRNDQVLVDLKLFTREQLKQIAEAVEDLFHVLISQSNKYKDVLMPGYTHLQIAMPSSFGFVVWCLCREPG